MGRVTIKDIAIRAGVSRTAVSFAFNQPNRLPEATVQRILEVAEELGYVPNPIARSMSTGHTGVIGILVPQPITEILRNPFLSEFLAGVGEACTAAGYNFMLVPPFEGSVQRAVGRAVVDGFLIIGLEVYKSAVMVLQQRDVPFVLVDGDPVDGVSVVNIDDEGGAYQAMKYILEAGHRRIAIFSIRSGHNGRYHEYTGTLKRRITGYLRALREFNLDIDGFKVFLLECASTINGGRYGFHKIWKRKHPPTAIVAMSDIIAIGALNAAHEAKIRIPEDISIIGFDDIPLSRVITPPLTTIAQPLSEKGKLATEILIKHISGRANTEHHCLPISLIERQSVKSFQ